MCNCRPFKPGVHHLASPNLGRCLQYARPGGGGRTIHLSLFLRGLSRCSVSNHSDYTVLTLVFKESDPASCCNDRKFPDSPLLNLFWLMRGLGTFHPHTMEAALGQFLRRFLTPCDGGGFFLFFQEGSFEDGSYEHKPSAGPA